MQPRMEALLTDLQTFLACKSTLHCLLGLNTLAGQPWVLSTHQALGFSAPWLRWGREKEDEEGAGVLVRAPSSPRSAAGRVMCVLQRGG